MSASRQGSASFTIVLGGLTALVVGAIMLTFVLFPIRNAFVDAAFWGSASTAPGQRITTTVGGLWVFWPAIILIAITIWIWVTTRQ